VSEPLPPSPSADDLSFDAATALRSRADRSTFDFDVHPLWTVGDKPNGGFLLALLGRAAAQVIAADAAVAWDVQSATVTYLAAPALEPAEIRTTVLRHGRTASHVRAVLVQSDRTLVDAVLVLGALAPGTAPRYSDIAPLHIPSPDECIRLPPRTPEGVPVGVLVTTDLRLDPLTVPGAPEPGGDGPPVAELRGWLRFADGREPDAASLLYFADAMPPATLLIGSSGWVPTLSLSVYVRARPAPGWLGVRFTAGLVSAGTVDETCTLWDSRGRVVAQATQLARLRFPDEAG
jgi:acyl-coenzyme A thioesterase PaaI-like protein